MMTGSEVTVLCKAMSFLNYFTNSDHHPVFLTRVFVQQARGNRPYLRTKPLSLEFKKESYVAGVVWWGVNESLANAQGTQSAR